MPLTPGGFLPFGIKVLEEHASLLSGRASAFTLHASDGFSERIVYACGSGLYVFSAGERSGTGITEALLRTQKVTEADIDAALLSCRDSGMSLKDALAARGSISADEYDEIARRLVLDEVLDLVFWEDAQYSTYEAPPPTEFFNAESHLLQAEMVPGAIDDAILSWVRKWLAWKPILRSDVTPLRLEPGGLEKATGSSDTLSALLRACRKGGSIRSLRRDTDLGLPAICERVVQAIDAGYLSIPPDAPPPPSARQSIEKLEKVLPVAIGKDLIRLRLASVYRRAGDAQKACATLQVVANQASSRGDRSLAMDCLRSILNIRPDDTGALRSLVEILVGRGRPGDAVQAALQVEQALLEEEKREAIRVVTDILGELGDHLAVREVHADLKLLEGRAEEALEEYCAIAARHEAAGGLDRAVQALGKAFRIDGENAELKARLVRLKQRARGGPPAAAKTPSPKPAPKPAPRLVKTPAPSARSRARPVTALLLVGGVALAILAILGTGERPEVEADGSATEEIATVVEEEIEPAGAEPAPPAVETEPVERASAPRPPRPAPARPPAEPGSARRKPASLPVTRGAPPRPRAEPPPAPAVPAGKPGPVVHGRVEPPSPALPPPVAAPEDRAVARSSPPAPTPPDEAKGLGPEEESLSLDELFEDVLPAAPCKAHQTHPVRVRKLPRGRRVLLADGCFLRIEEAATLELVLECEGEEGSRWAYDAAGEVVCRWAPGKALRGVSVHPDGDWPAEGYELPADTSAIAVSPSEVAILVGAGTRVVRFPEGQATLSTAVISWKEGLFTGGMLLLLADARAEDGALLRRRIALDPRTLDPLVLPAPGPGKTLPAGAPEGGSGSTIGGPAGERTERSVTGGSPEG